MSQDRNTNRFGRRRPGTDRATRASQTRLVVLVGLFLMVVAMMQHARQPSTWQWMWRMNNPGVPVDVDPRLKPEPPNGEPVGSFVSPSGKNSAEDTASNSFRLKVPPERLNDIRDDTYFRPAEKETWFYLFSLLNHASDETIDGESLGNVSTLQLYRQPDSYRGKLVNVAGTVRRAHRVVAPQNDQGIESYWQLWLFEEDGLTAPCVLYVLDMPREFPEGMSVEASVTLTGFSYKRWAYQGADGDLMVAPVVLAKNLKWSQTKPESRPSISREQIIWSIVLALALSVVIVRWTLIWSGRSRRRAAKIGDGDDPSVGFEFLDERKDDIDS